MTDDLVVLLDEFHQPSGTAPRISVHTEQTPLHLAFSCWLINDSGEILLTRRALTKRAWPGVWTNSFCGHPKPDEAMLDAVVRRAGQELGAGVTQVEVLLPEFKYRAVDASGVVENEFCPVFIGRHAGALDPVPDEVMEFQWVGVEALREARVVAPWALSPWVIAQIDELVAAGEWSRVVDYAFCDAVAESEVTESKTTSNGA